MKLYIVCKNPSQCLTCSLHSVNVKVMDLSLWPCFVKVMPYCMNPALWNDCVR